MSPCLKLQMSVMFSYKGGTYLSKILKYTENKALIIKQARETCGYCAGKSSSGLTVYLCFLM